MSETVDSEAWSPPRAADVKPSLSQLRLPGWRGISLALASLLCFWLAFGPLVNFDADPILDGEFEGMFFTPSDTSPAVVLLLAGWLVYRRWGRLRALPLAAGPAWVWLGLLSLSAGLLGWSVYVAATDLRMLALMAAIQGFASYFGGFPAMRALLVPTVFLLFALPMPAPLLNAILLEMQFWTADFAGALLHLGGQTAFVAGDQILREDNTFAIIETCSGVRIIETLSMLTILMLDLFRRPARHSAILLSCAPFVAFLTNGIRALTLILNPHSDIKEIHTLQGIFMLLGGLIVLYALDGLLARWLKLPPPPEFPTAPVTAAPALLPRSRVRFAAAVVGMLALIAVATPTWQVPELEVDPALLDDFERVGGWRSRKLEVDRQFQGRIGGRTDSYRLYRSGDRWVEAYLAVGNRNYRPRTVLFSKAQFPGSGWTTREEGSLTLEPGGHEAIWRVQESGTHRELVISWYEAAGSIWAESLRSFAGLDQSRFRRPGDEVALRISTPIHGTSPEDHARAESQLLGFYAELRPLLDRLHSRLRSDTT